MGGALFYCSDIQAKFGARGYPREASRLLLLIPNEFLLLFLPLLSSIPSFSRLVINTSSSSSSFLQLLLKVLVLLMLSNF